MRDSPVELDLVQEEWPVVFCSSAAAVTCEHLAWDSRQRPRHCREVVVVLQGTCPQGSYSHYLLDSDYRR